ncbi:MAG: 2OG-Fe(II) oxygenase [Cyclobacteriaceae bacterium]
MNTSKLLFELPQLHQYAAAYSYENHFSKSEIDQLNQAWEANNQETATVTGGNETVNSGIRRSSVVTIAPNQQELSWFYKKLSDLVLKCNQECYGFDLHGIYEPIQIIGYETGDFFEWHADYGNGYSSNRKLSVSVQISSPDQYEGGELQFMVNKQVISVPKTEGTVVIFPSYIMHRVNKITKGERRSVVCWISGPPFK